MAFYGPIVKFGSLEVANGAVVREKLPFPYVHYPNMAATFLGFSESEDSPVVLCGCSKGAVANLLRLRHLFAIDPHPDALRKAPLDSMFFPNVIAEKSLKYTHDPLSSVDFAERLCHRCNLAAPKLRYWHGVRFIQKYGWYVSQAFLRFGIYSSHTFPYLSEVCPQEWQEEIEKLRKVQQEAEEDRRRILSIAYGPKREDIGDDEITYWANVRQEEARTMVELGRRAERMRRGSKKGSRTSHDKNSVLERLGKPGFPRRFF